MDITNDDLEKLKEKLVDPEISASVFDETLRRFTLLQQEQ